MGCLQTTLLSASIYHFKDSGVLSKGISWRGHWGLLTCRGGCDLRKGLDVFTSSRGHGGPAELTLAV